ncbi:Membrane protein involved in the export of O-antigen and teichoic acid [Nocardioides exalbidus]|uniref:Membrane protein involved in the export of O-antigen and teichoic acid n=1 Tax=Nocardioides exalbidus TaxID=402596 RepID=A0A1H4MSS0_9ACTN|nr:hypothetical protein [Nocardioides exalbidus]SEB86086.1 Membrane protein involved in the export of O-antigen and teichoic acid [Nocardioides exalbidus]
MTAPARPPAGRRGPISRITSSRVLSTSATNLAIAGGAALGGVMLARGLGPEDRGVYAAVFVWMTYLLALSEGGLNAAVVYFLGKAPGQLGRIVRLALGGVVQQTVVILGLAVGVVLLLDLGPALTRHYLLGFALLVPALVGGVFTAALYGLDLRRWNLARAIQMPVYTGGILVLLLLDAVAVDRALVVYGLSVGVSGLTSVLLLAAARHSAVAGAVEGEAPVERGSLRAYAVRNAAWVVPAMTNTRVDQLALSVTASPATLGVYAIASTWSQMASPAISAIGNELLPRISAETEAEARHDSARIAVRRAAVGGLAVGVVSALLAWPAIHLLFGRNFSESVLLSVALAPAAWGIAVRYVSADVLRGVGRPQTAAAVEGAALLVGVPALLLTGLLANGLAVALVMSVVSAASAWILMRRALSAAAMA